MSDLFQPCTSCGQHVRIDERACPFCDAALPADFGAEARARVSAGRPLSRAAILFVGATAAAACGGSTDEPTTSDASTQNDGSARDGSAADSAIDGPLVLYGPAPIDASVQDSAVDADSGPVAAYGPGPIDSGGG
jgi:hypothetical protein